jgi:glucose-1-phosphate cytidylyltransferase
MPSDCWSFSALELAELRPKVRESVKVVIFCGGQGMRLEVGAFSERLPKPMASIGGRPLLWHIMRYYAHFEHTEFVLCLGYRGGAIQDYFRRSEFADVGWKIEFVDTGLESSIGERLARVRDQVADSEVFLASYGDTLTDAPLPLLIAAHAASGKVASLLAARPNYSFNVIDADADHVVTRFADVTQSGMWINGGFFVFRQTIFDYIHEGDDLPDTLRRLIEDRQLLAYEYEGFWAPMDTLKDRERLEGLVQGGGSVWQVWATDAAADTPAVGPC